MSTEEKAKALRFAGGEHWIKVTFESAEAADAAVDSSPQTILGHIVYAELYRGVPPPTDEAIPADLSKRTPRNERFSAQSLGNASGLQAQSNRRPSSTLPRSFATPTMSEVGRGGNSLSPPDSYTSTQTLESATLSHTSATASSATVTGYQSQPQTQQNSQELLYCAKIPTAKRMQLLPAEQALLPQKSYSQRIVSNIPLIGWLSSDIIGNAVPRTENGDFDWAKASLYWKLMWWVDSWTGWFDIVGGEKED
jgi:hypothetical protein